MLACATNRVTEEQRELALISYVSPALFRCISRLVKEREFVDLRKLQKTLGLRLFEHKTGMKTTKDRLREVSGHCEC